MQKVYKLEGEICANCAAKIEDKVAKLPGVTKASVSVMTMKFTLEAADEGFEQTLAEAVKIFGKVEPDCTVIVK